MKYLVTGSGGFIGQHLCRKLLSEGYRVIGLDDFSGCRKGPFIWSTQIGSVADHALVDYLVRNEEPDYVIHAAAYAAECLSPFIRNYNYINNVVGTANIVTACIKYDVKRLDFLSSVAVYGRMPCRRSGHHEMDTCFPSDPYGNAKLCCEKDIQIAHEQHGLNYRNWRMHNVFGLLQHINDPFRNVIGIFINKLMNNVPLPIFGKGTQIRQFTPVEYVVEGITSQTVPDNDIYNIGSDQESTINQIATELIAIFLPGTIGTEGLYSHLPPRHEAFHPTCDHGKIQKYLGPCDYDLKTELRKVVEWAKSATHFESKLPTIELQKGLPESWKNYIV